MTMLKKENWNNDECRYEVPIKFEEIPDVQPWDNLDASAKYLRVAFWDRFTKNWIVDIIDPEGHQVTGAEFFANKRSFIY